MHLNFENITALFIGADVYELTLWQPCVSRIRTAFLALDGAQFIRRISCKSFAQLFVSEYTVATDICRITIAKLDAYRKRGLCDFRDFLLASGAPARDALV
ncbi:MAG: hypothetical protein IKT96_01895 [Paludibacteraceae bacterium]|nr:hypothetical protein [Paludibacteraceae bacterium]